MISFDFCAKRLTLNEVNQELITRMNQKFCNILITWGISGCLCWGCEHEKFHWAVKSWVCLILSNYDSLDLPHEAQPQNPCFFLPNWPFLIIKVLGIQAKFLESSGYCIGINFAFTFCTTNIFSCFHSIIFQFRVLKNWAPELNYIAHSSLQLSNHIKQ